MSSSPSSKISLESQSPLPSVYLVYYEPASVELKFSSTYLYDLESLLLRILYPTPEIKEALHEIKKESNSSVTTNLEDTFE